MWRCKKALLFGEAALFAVRLLAFFVFFEVLEDFVELFFVLMDGEEFFAIDVGGFGEDGFALFKGGDNGVFGAFPIALIVVFCFFEVFAEDLDAALTAGGELGAGLVEFFGTFFFGGGHAHGDLLVGGVEFFLDLSLGLGEKLSGEGFGVTNDGVGLSGGILKDGLGAAAGALEGLVIVFGVFADEFVDEFVFGCAVDVGWVDFADGCEGADEAQSFLAWDEDFCLMHEWGTAVFKKGLKMVEVVADGLATFLGGAGLSEVFLELVVILCCFLLWFLHDGAIVILCCGVFLAEGFCAFFAFFYECIEIFRGILFFREAWFFDAASGWFEEIFEGEWIWLVVIFIGEGVLFFLSGDLVVDVEGGFWALLRDILFWFLGRMAALDGGLVCEGVEVIDEAGTGFFGLFADGRALQAALFCWFFGIWLRGFLSFWFF